MNISVLVLSLLLALTGIFIYTLWRSDSKAKQELAKAKEEQVRLEAERDSQKQQAEQQVATARAEEQAKIASLQTELKNTKEKLASTEEISLKVGKKVSEQVTQDWLGQLTKPLATQMKSFEEKLTQANKSGEEKLASLKTTLDVWHKASARINESTTALTNALTGTQSQKAQGNWGESTLKTLLESTGFVEGQHFDAEQHWVSEDGKAMRPDFVIKLPDKRMVVIDSKVTLTAWVDWHKSEDEAERERLEKEVVGSIRKHIKDLRDRQYHKFAPKGWEVLDFTIMYVPVEPALHFALSRDPNLLTEAQKDKVTVVGATLLLPLLQTLLIYWQTRQQQESQVKIVKAGEAVLNQVHLFVESFEKAERGISQASQSIQEARNRLTDGKGNLLRRAENLETLGIRIARKKKQGSMWDELRENDPEALEQQEEPAEEQELVQIEAGEEQEVQDMKVEEAAEVAEANSLEEDEEQEDIEVSPEVIAEQQGAAPDQPSQSAQ